MNKQKKKRNEYVESTKDQTNKPFLSLGFATRNSMENVENDRSENANGNETYQYPNTYHLNEDDSKSDSNDNNNNNNNQSQPHHSTGQKIKHLLHFKTKSHKKKKHNKHDQINYNTISQSTDPDSDSIDNYIHNNKHNHHHHHHRMGSVNHQPISQHHSDSNLHGTTAHDSIFEREPLMQSVSEPHLITSLPTPRTISDNSHHNTSKHHNNNHKHASFHHHPNPNYRLSQKNNLGGSHHINHNDDGRHSPNTNHPHLSNTNSSSGLLGNAYNTTNPTSMHTIIEVEDQKTDQHHSNNPTSFPYNQTQSVQMTSKPIDDNDDNKYNNNNDDGNNSRHVRFKKIQNIDTNAGQTGGIAKKSNNRKESTSIAGKTNDDVNGGKSNTIDANNNDDNNGDNKDNKDNKERKASLSYSAQHVYKKKKRTKSSEQPNDKKDDDDQLHLYTTPTTSNVSELMASQQ